jgi:hypothetical protein
LTSYHIKFKFNYRKTYNSPDFYLPAWRKFCTTSYFSRSGVE